MQKPASKSQKGIRGGRTSGGVGTLNLAADQSSRKP
jgi:hypothetical protein